MTTDNSRLVFDSGNQWIKERDSAPFFGVPAWWRRFWFQLLTPREITVYLYMCSVMDPNAVAYPTVEQLAEDMGVKSRSTIVDALGRLVELGFLLRGPEPYRGRVMGKRVVYQRPLPHYTILELLRNRLVDGDLYPAADPNKERNFELTGGSDAVVRAGLRRLLGEENFQAYQSLKNPYRRWQALIAALQAHMDKVRAGRRREAEDRIAMSSLKLDNLPEEMRQIIEEETEENNAGVPF